ncbi:carbohydrate esterase family 16 protein [Plicaturopsis crispa FD-325 SS-3]|nr:carbohydrate esterase family 16 protein [Plicaturopsis crispa FD-325 SS-3]
MSVVIQLSRSWPEFTKIKHLIVFGDSYSSVAMRSKFTPPTRRDPLGLPYPGYPFTEDNQPNWVGHLLSKYAPRIRYNPSKKTAVDLDGKQVDEPPILVYDFAVGGDTVHGVSTQVERHFLPYHAAVEPSDDTWTGNNSLFVTWVGINDCGQSPEEDHAGRIDILLSAHEKLYAVGARNFLFIDVPPVERSPAVPETRADYLAPRFKHWNETLLAAIRTFSAAHPDITTMMFSSYETFTRFLDDPTGHGVPAKDLRKQGGEIWIDHIHPGTKVHNFVARDLAQFLNGVKQTEESDA